MQPGTRKWNGPIVAKHMQESPNKQHILKNNVQARGEGGIGATNRNTREKAKCHAKG